MAGRATVADLADRCEASVEGDAKALQRLAELLDTVESWFDIVTP